MQWSRGAKQACLGGEILEFSLPPWESTTSGPGKARGAFAVCPPSLPHASWLEQGEAESTLGSRLAGPQAGRALCTQHSSPRVPGLWAVGCGLVRLTSAPGS